MLFVWVPGLPFTGLGVRGAGVGLKQRSEESFHQGIGVLEEFGSREDFGGGLGIGARGEVFRAVLDELLG